MDSSRAFQTIESVLGNMFGPLNKIGYGSWDLFWIGALIISIFLLAFLRPWKKSGESSLQMDFFINFITTYLVLIVLLGFLRTEPYTGIRWGDSASRMLSHLAPLVGLLLGMEFVHALNKFKKVE